MDRQTFIQEACLRGFQGAMTHGQIPEGRRAEVIGDIVADAIAMADIATADATGLKANEGGSDLDSALAAWFNSYAGRAPAYDLERRLYDAILKTRKERGK